jgi:hypothetical protein
LEFLVPLLDAFDRQRETCSGTIEQLAMMRGPESWGFRPASAAMS